LIRKSGGDDTDELITKIYEDYKLANPKTEVDKKVVIAALEKVMYQIIRTNVLKTGKRVDGRKMDESAPLPHQLGFYQEPTGVPFFKEALPKLYQLLL